MATSRAADKLQELRESKCRVEAEARRLVATMTSAIALADSVAADADVVITGEVVVDSAIAGQTTFYIARPPMKNLVVKKAGQTLTISDADEETGLVTLSAPLAAEDRVTASYKHIGLASELQELLQSLPRMSLAGISAFGATRTKYNNASAWLKQNLA